MALAGLFVFLACQGPTAAPVGPSVRQRLPGPAVPLDDKAQRTPAQKKIDKPFRLPLPARVISTLPVIRNLPARLIGWGLRPERVRMSQW